MSLINLPLLVGLCLGTNFAPSDTALVSNYPSAQSTLAEPDGYVDKESPVKTGDPDSEIPAELNLDAVTVSARVVSRSNSSLRVVNLDKEKLLQNSTGRTYVELIRNVPGVYSTSESGSYGDAKINIRGFKQENISVLLNGIPISGLTSGSMYWNNWMGLSDATASIQIQKGIGNSMLSDNSVGGTINILTVQPDAVARPSATLAYGTTGYGAQNAMVNISTGELGRGWALSLMGSHSWGSSYAECTGMNVWSYLAVVTKRFGSRNVLNFTALGSPEKHQQRSQRLSLAEVEKYGTAYNKNWGWYRTEDGKLIARTLSKNNYFKPYFTLSHSYDGRVDGRGVRVMTSVYSAFANGGGYFTESNGKRIASFLGTDGHIDWNAVENWNQAVTPDADGRRAVNIMSDYRAGHTQAGIKSNVVVDFNDRWSLDVGVHGQMYLTWEEERITDLLGADYWYEDYATKSLIGMSGRNPIKHVGDKVRTDNGRNQYYGTVYGIMTYVAGAKKSTILTLGASASGTTLRRWDDYNYTKENRFSERASRGGGSVKMGVLHKLGRSVSIYANAAAYSRAPYANVFFSSGNNSVSKDLVNEKNYLAEGGVRVLGSRLTFEATAYAAYWQDKTLMSSAYKTVDEDPCKYMVKGLNAFHAGVEAEATYAVCKPLTVSAFASFGWWRWMNDVTATIYDPYTMAPVQEINVYAKGLHVGDAPQTQIGATLDVKIYKGLSAHAEWNFNDRFWADFEPSSRTSAGSGYVDSCRLPSYHLLNMGVSWAFGINHFAGTLFFNVNNVTDAQYVERSKDGSTHDMQSLTAYWANGRNLNFGVRFRFN